MIDYDMGNVGSILNMLRRLGFAASLSSEPTEIRNAAGLILPGVGAFDQGMGNLRERGLTDCLDDAVLNQRKPLLGICLGMQLLTEGSEEGKLPGLGWVSGHCRRFDFSREPEGRRIPHMGWNRVFVRPRPTGEENLAAVLFANTDPNQRYYFVHSYYPCCASDSDVLAEAIYGYRFPAAIGSRNVVGTQFHPEKSHRFGMRLIQNFASFVSGRVEERRTA